MLTNALNRKKMKIKTKLALFISSILALLLVYLNLSQHQTPTHLYKVLSSQNWELSKNQPFVKLDLSMDNNFIHLAREDQLAAIINKFWNKETAFIILKLFTKKLNGTLVFESNPGGSNKYYHLYNGNIPMTAVVNVEKMQQ